MNNNPNNKTPNRASNKKQYSAENKVSMPSDCKHGHCDKGNHEKSYH